MRPSFDLGVEPWMPVTVGSGGELVGLRELFRRAHELTDLAVGVPPAQSGGLRILYAIAARISGLDRPGGWTDRRLDLLDAGGFDPAAVDAYFDRWADRFDLFHPVRPWLQDPRLVDQCPKPAGVNKLVFDRPAGNNQVWFGHHTDAAPVAVETVDAAWCLIAQLYYGASGRCSTRIVDGQSYANTAAGPLRSTLSFHPTGRTLFETLVSGLPAPQDDEQDEPLPWERADLPDPLQPPATRSVLSALTGPFQHGVLLLPDSSGRTVTDAYLTWAAREKANRPLDAYVIRRRTKDGRWYAAPAEGHRALWRNLDALLADQKDRSQRPPALVAAGDLRVADQLTVRAFGFDQDGQAKDRQWFTASTPPILRWRAEQDAEAAAGIEQLCGAAERVGWRLGAAVKDAWAEVATAGGKNATAGPWQQRAASYYWSHAEGQFWTHAERRHYDAYPAFLTVARRAIDHVLAEQPTPRLAKAATTAHRRLTEPRKEIA